MNKINILSIVSGHLSTLKHYGTGKISISDVVLFYLSPLLFVGLYFYVGGDLENNLVNIIVTSGSIFTALLLNLLILVYDQKNKLPKMSGGVSVSASDERRHEVLRQSYYNIAYCTLVSLAIVFICISQMFFHKKEFTVFDTKIAPSEDFISPLIIYVGIHLVLSLLMVIKRIFALMQSDR